MIKDLSIADIFGTTSTDDIERTLEHFRAIVESSDDAIISKSLDGIVTSWNRGAQSVFGYSEREMLGRPLLAIFPPDRLDEEDYILRQVLQGTKVDHFETERLHKNGNRINVSVTISPIRDRHGVVIGASKIARDITLQKVTEAQLRLTANVFASSSEGVLITTSDGLIADVNQAFTRITGYMRDEVLGKDVRTIGPDRQSLRSFKRMRRSLVQSGEWKSELWGRRKDGVPVSVLITASRVCDTNGVVCNYVVLLSDITPLKLQQEKIASFFKESQQKIAVYKQAEDQLRLLEKAVSGLNDILLITEAEPIHGDGPRILFVNDAFERRTGYSREEVIGKTPRILQGPKTQRHELDRIGAAMARWEPVRAELINYTKSGEEFWLELEIMPIADANGWFTHWVAVERDISPRKAMEQQLLESSHHTQAILNNVVDGIITVDGCGKIESFNPAASKIFGYDLHEVIGQDVGLLMQETVGFGTEDDPHGFKASDFKCTPGIARELHGKHKSGVNFPITLALSEIVRQGKPLYIGLVRDITERRKVEAEIQRLAFHDHLTELPNRRLLFDRMTRALAANYRSEQIGAVIFIDLDDFKALNDSRGHETGDQMLLLVAQRLNACVREGDTVARLGGDEFVVMLENLGLTRDDAASNAEHVAIQLMASFAEPFNLCGQEHRGTASIGITLFGQEQLSADELMNRADSAMYRAKSDGRNAYRFFDAELQASLVARTAMELALSQSIVRHELHLNYQPQIDRHGKVLGCEALARWTQSERGIISPAEFIPMAERTGFIFTLGQWVLQTACMQLALWAQTPLTAKLTVSVNVSARQFRHPQFVTQVMDALALSGADPKLLILELTESMLVDDVDSIVESMSLLKARGINFSLDDFGTGFSSLSYLKRLPLDELKIDQSFVRDVLANPQDAAISRTIVALGKSLGLSVIAEGVETAGQRDFLEEIGCFMFQGYFFSRPITAAQVDDYIRNVDVESRTKWPVTTPHQK